MALTQISQAGAKDEAINEAKIQISNAGTNGQYLQKQSGNTGGLTWADVPAGVGGATGVDFNDDVKIRLGTGNDLEIFHDASNSYIKDVATGGLILTTDSLIQLQKGTSEVLASFGPDGSCNLFHDNSKKLETASDGIAVTGSVTIPDNSSGTTNRLKIGSSNDLQLYHDATNTRITNSTGALVIEADDININNLGSTESLATFDADGAVALYHNNVKTFQTEANGATFMGPEGSAGWIQIFSDEGDDNGDKWRLIKEGGNENFSIQNYKSGSWETNILATGDGAVELYYDNTKKFETTSDGWKCADSVKGVFGAGDDLQIYHDGTNSYIKDAGTGQLILLTNSFRLNNAANGENIITAEEDGAVNLFYNDSKKLETTSDGITMTGNILFSSGNNGLYLGGSGGGNHLNDYEEGTFTPAWNTGSSASAMMSAAAYESYTNGKYIKVDDLVTFTIVIECSSHTNNSGQAVILTGLPFTSENTDAKGGAWFTIAKAVSSGTTNQYMPVIRNQNNTTYMQFFHGNASQYDSDESTADWNDKLELAGFYWAA